MREANTSSNTAPLERAESSGIHAIPKEPLNAAAAATEWRIPSLDGLRAISILMVIVGHLDGAGGFPRLHLPIGDYASLGVRVFFVISGYLITSLLFKEIDKTHTISLKDFYVRRVFRIFPAFYAFLATLTTAALLGVIALPWRDLAFASSYTINFVHPKSWFVGHIWSLSVEEQFYLLWPATLAVLGRRKGMRVALGVMCVAPLARLTWFYAMPEHQTLITEAFPTVADAIAAGCLLAALRDRLGALPRFLAFLRSPFFWLVPLAICVVNVQPYFRLRWLCGETLINVGIALVVERFIRYPASPAGRFLNSAAMSFAGVLSYSLYLWQQLFLDAHHDYWWTRFPQNIACTAAFALASYFLVERPMLSLRRNYSALGGSSRSQAALATSRAS